MPLRYGIRASQRHSIYLIVTLGWLTLERRRSIKQATTFYKIVDNITNITGPGQNILEIKNSGHLVGKGEEEEHRTSSGSIKTVTNPWPLHKHQVLDQHRSVLFLPNREYDK